MNKVFRSNVAMLSQFILKESNKVLTEERELHIMLRQDNY